MPRSSSKSPFDYTHHLVGIVILISGIVLGLITVSFLLCGTGQGIYTINKLYVNIPSP